VKALVVLLALILPIGLVAAGAASPAIVGSWKCIAVSENGMQHSLTLEVKQDGGNLAASLIMAETGDVLPGLEPKLDGNQFSFKVRINPTEVVDIVLKVDGNRLEGRFAGKDSGAGTFKATKVDISGKWSGQWEISPDGAPGPHYMVLNQDGQKVTGTAGPNPGMQINIQNGKFADDKLTFDISAPNGLSVRFEFNLVSETMQGQAVLTMNGTDKRLKLSAKRVTD
jgi:hypothetical protein